MNTRQGSTKSWDNINQRNQSTLHLEKRVDPETYSTFSQDTVAANKNSWINIIKGLWTTRQILPKNAEKESIMGTTLRELFMYIIFLITVSCISLAVMNPSMYYQTKLLSELFLDSNLHDGNTFRTATQMDQFWKFAENVLIDSLYWEKWYNNKKIEVIETSILYENYLITSPKLRQLRVRNDSCEVHKDFRKTIHNCYNSYADYLEERSTIKNNITGFTWSEINSFAKNSIWGLIATYSGDGGYIVELGFNKTIAKQIILTLKNNLWIDRGTRVVFIDFTTYNPNMNLFVVCKLIAEFPATGGMLTSWQFRTLNLLKTGSKETVDIILLILFILFIIYYIIEELIEIKTLGFNLYLRISFWNIIDLLSIIISILCISFSIYREFIINKIFYQAESSSKLSLSMSHLPSEQLKLTKMETYQFDKLGFWSAQYNNMLSILSFIVWIKIFKYISFNKTMIQLSSTLSRCAKDIAGFGVMFFIIFFAFAQLGYLLFGTQIKDYHSFGTAVFTLLRLILGDFNFHELESANRVLGPIFFLSYIFFVFFVLMNMFLAIINDTYTEVKGELLDNQDEFPIMEFFKNSYNFLIKLGKQREKLEGIQEALKTDGSKLSYEHARSELRKRNLTDTEIEMLFAKYDLDSNRELDKQELNIMFADLEGKKTQLDKEIAEEQKRPASSLSRHRFAEEQIIKLTQRVDKMEHILMIISNKINDALEGKLILPSNIK